MLQIRQKWKTWTSIPNTIFNEKTKKNCKIKYEIVKRQFSFFFFWILTIRIPHSSFELCFTNLNSISRNNMISIFNRSICGCNRCVDAWNSWLMDWIVWFTVFSWPMASDIYFIYMVQAHQIFYLSCSSRSHWILLCSILLSCEHTRWARYLCYKQ